MRFLTWRFGELGKDRQIKTRQFKLNVCTPIMLSIQITKFKFRQYQLKAISPNLMLAKITRCMVIVTINYGIP